MKEFARKVLLAVAPVIGACLGIAILRAAHLPFPPELSSDAWAEWLVFAAVVHTFTALGMFVTELLLGSGHAIAPEASQRPA